MVWVPNDDRLISPSQKIVPKYLVQRVQMRREAATIQLRLFTSLPKSLPRLYSLRLNIISDVGDANLRDSSKTFTQTSEQMLSDSFNSIELLHLFPLFLRFINTIK